MKKSFIILLLLFSAIPVWFAACKPGKDNPEPRPELPPITQEGNNTFGCLINGEVFVPQKNSLGIECYYYDKGWNIDLAGTFALFARNTAGNKTQSIGFQLYECVFGTGEYLLDEKYEFSKILRITSIYSNNRYYCRENMFGKINFTFIDTVNRIISGTFEFDGVNKDNSSDTIRVRKGRFDVIYNY